MAAHKDSHSAKYSQQVQVQYGRGKFTHCCNSLCAKLCHPPATKYVMAIGETISLHHLTTTAEDTDVGLWAKGSESL